ncbi:MAG: universal stress protein [Acidovorax sp.]|nr:universal stress protein [Acidovorax sp.]
MYEKILVPVDGSPTSLRGLREAIQVARLSGGRLKLLHVVDEMSFMTGLEAGVAMTTEILQLLREGGEKVVSDALAEVRAAGLDADTELFESYAGRVSDLVIAKAQEWGARLIVLGTHGRRGVGRMLLGSDAEQIVRLSPVPVLLVRGSA